MIRKIKKTLQEIKKNIKQLEPLKGAKSLIFLKCDSCESANLELVRSTIQSSELEVDNGARTYSKVTYNVYCNKCGAIGQMTEIWTQENK